VVQIETEVKVRVGDPRHMRARLRSLGADMTHPRLFEDNFVLDFPDRRILRQESLLRVRLSGKRASLTYKGPARRGKGFKSRREIETGIEDGPGLLRILFRLGLRPQFQYQKFKTSFRKSPVLITLEETPIGDFLEIEGPRRGIDVVAAGLGYRRADYITKTYYELFVEYRATNRRRNKNMIFDINE